MRGGSGTFPERLLAAAAIAVIPGIARAHNPGAALLSVVSVALLAVVLAGAAKRLLSSKPRTGWSRLAGLAAVDLGLAGVMAAAMFNAWRLDYVVAAALAAVVSAALHLVLIRGGAREGARWWLAFAFPALFVGLGLLLQWPLYVAFGG